MAGCELVTSSGKGAVWYSSTAFGNDYTLRLDWKAASANADSGVFVGFDHPAGNPDVPHSRGWRCR
jgi:hypothetical protein